MKPKEIEQLAEKISIDRAAIDHQRILSDAEAALESFKRPAKSRVPVPLPGRFPLLVCSGSLAAAFLIVSSLVACYVLSRKVGELRNELKQAQRDVILARQNIASAQTNDTATINLYLKEYQNAVARHASFSPAAPQPAQMNVSREDILYYEMFDDQPEYMRPGIIVRGPLSQGRTSSLKAPTISNGHTLSLSEAKKTANFYFVAPPWLYPYYRLDQIRKIEGRDALQLIYTDGINPLSLFEQPLDGKYRLSRQDFREYAVYRNKEKTGGTILTWRNDSLSYVLIGNAELTTLMDIAQSINAIK
jgi:hypothetical protein